MCPWLKLNELHQIENNKAVNLFVDFIATNNIMYIYMCMYMYMYAYVAKKIVGSHCCDLKTRLQQDKRQKNSCFFTINIITKYPRIFKIVFAGSKVSKY